MYTGDRWQSPMKSSMELAAEFPARAKDKNRGKSAKKKGISRWVHNLGELQLKKWPTVGDLLFFPLANGS